MIDWLPQNFKFSLLQESRRQWQGTHGKNFYNNFNPSSEVSFEIKWEYLDLSIWPVALDDHSSSSSVAYADDIISPARCWRCFDAHVPTSLPTKEPYFKMYWPHLLGIMACTIINSIAIPRSSTIDPVANKSTNESSNSIRNGKHGVVFCQYVRITQSARVISWVLIWYVLYHLYREIPWYYVANWWCSRYIDYLEIRYWRLRE